MQIALAIFILNTHALAFAGCKCDDWMDKGGYCVDYIKSRIPSFPIPQNQSEITTLKNKDILEVEEGDVAMFNHSNYWHVAYVEKIHYDQHGVAIAIDISEMNFGTQLSFSEYKAKWKNQSNSEWKRAICCGITDKYDQTSSRQYISLNTIKQIWSPEPDATDIIENNRGIIFGKIKGAVNRILQFTGAW